MPLDIESHVSTAQEGIFPPSTPKWRELHIDPFEIDLGKNIVLKEVISYPHAGNDVLRCLCYQSLASGRVPLDIHLKIERRQEAKLSKEYNMLQLMSQIKQLTPCVPECLCFGTTPSGHTYLGTKTLEGVRLSQIITGSFYANEFEQVLKLLTRFGKSLADIHNLKMNCPEAPSRVFHKILSFDEATKLNLMMVRDWLLNHEPKASKKEKCFIHGDHHYANVLFKAGEVSAVLDWELSGLGWKEFDMAWASIHRPGQKFMKSEKETEAFLQGFEAGSFSKKAYDWCRVLIYCHFYANGAQSGDSEYMASTREKIEKIVRSHISKS